MTTRRCLLPLLLCAAAIARGAVLEEPSTRWTMELPAGMQRGNALVSAGPSRLIATTSIGSLHVLDTQGNILMNYDPTELDPLSCTSGVAVVGGLAVYSVYNPSQDNSRVIALDWNEGSVEWSQTLEGKVEGTPMVGQSGIYVVHNVQISGRVTLIDGSSGVVGSFPSERDPVGQLGPGSLQVVQGRDVIAVAESRSGGFSTRGNLYMLVQDQPDRDGAFGFRWELASSHPRSAVAAPTLSNNLAVFLAQQGGLLSAWVGRRDLSGVFQGNADDLTPRWERFLEEDPDDGGAPVLASPKITNDGSLLLAAGAGPEVYCLRAEEARSSWVRPTSGKVVASPVLSEIGEDEDEFAVYFMEESGILRSYRINDEEDPLIWERNVCGDDCVSVEAEFCLAESGNMLYYGDVAGRVRAVNVAAFATEAPSGVPSPMPSQAPSKAPAVPSVGPSLIPSPMPSSVPSAAPTIISSAVPTIGATEETTGVPSAGTGSGNDDTGDNDGSGGTGDTDGAGEIDDTEGPGDTDDTDSAGNADGAGDSDDADDTGDTVSDGGDDAAALDKEVAGITGDSPPGSSGLSGKPLAYIGIAGGVLFLLSVLGCLFIFFLRKRSVVSKDKQRDLEAAEEKEKWRGEKNAYDKACKDAEKETLTELGVKGKVVDSLPRTPSTALASISETPDDPKETHAKQRDEELGEEIGFEMSITDSSQPQTRSLLPKNLTKRFAKSTTYSNSVPEFTRTGSDTDLKQRDSFDAPSVGGDTLNSASYAGYSDIQSTTEASASKDAAPPSIDGMNAASILQDMVRNKKRQTEKPATSEDQVDDELAAVNAALGNSGGVQSDNEEEPGRIQAGERKRPEPLPLPDEIARAASPFSDMLSVDSSLYYDESTVGTYSKKDCPDDESSRVSYSLGSLLGFGSSGRKPPTPVPEQESSPVASPSQDPPRPSPVPEPPKEAERAVPLPVSPKEPRVPVADKELVKKPDSTALLPEPAKASPQASRSVLKAAPVAEDTKMSIKLPKSKAQPQMEAQRSATAISIARDRREFHDNSPSRKLSHAGVSVRRGRSRAGLFTRRAERSNSDRSDSTRSMEPSSPAITRPEITPDGGTVSEVEELAYTAPKKVAHFEEARGQDKRSQKTNKPDSQETHNKEDAWNSFLSELSKAEATFFNPNDVEPPRSHSRSPSPPPPPPPRA